MTDTKTKKYSASLSSKAGLVDEAFVVLQLIADGKTEEEVRTAILDENALGKDTYENRSTVWTRLRLRFLNNWKRAQLLAKAVAQEANFNQARLLVYYDFCLSEPILYDAVTCPVFEWENSGFTGIEISDLQNWLDGIQNEHPEVEEWSPQTRKKILSNILTVLRDYGLMSGTARKKFERVFVSAPLAGYMLYSIRERIEGFGPRAAIASLDWRLFFLDEDDVVSLLKELAREGYCVFQKQGEVMTLELKWQNLEEYVEAIKGKV